MYLDVTNTVSFLLQKDHCLQLIVSITRNIVLVGKILYWEAIIGIRLITKIFLKVWFCGYKEENIIFENIDVMIEEYKNISSNIRGSI